MKTEIHQINDSLKQIYSYHYPHLEVKITRDSQVLSKIRKLRQKYYRTFKPDAFKQQTSNDKFHKKSLLEKQQAVIYDGYDSFAEHLIIIDHKSDQIVASARLIDAYTAYKIGGYYNETRFNLKHLLDHKMFYLEMSRVVIDGNYHSEAIAHLLWSGLHNYARTRGIDSLIGSFSLSLHETGKTLALIQRLKQQHISTLEYRVSPYQQFPDAKMNNTEIHQDNLVDYFFEKGCKICGDAHWNQDFNCAEIFFYCPLNTEPCYMDCINANVRDTGINYIC